MVATARRSRNQARLPEGYVAVGHAPALARQAFGERGQRGAGAIERDYAEVLRERTEVAAITPGGLACGKPSKYPGVFAHALGMLGEVWVDVEFVSQFAYEGLMELATRRLPDVLFANAFDDSQRHGGRRLRLWYSIGEVLLVYASLLEHLDPQRPRVAPLLSRLDQVRPQWRDEHTRNWRAPAVRAVGLRYCTIPEARRIDVNTPDEQGHTTAPQAWGHAQSVLVGVAGAVGARNAALSIHTALRAIDRPYARKWADWVDKLCASGVDLNTPVLAPDHQSVDGYVDETGQPVEPLWRSLDGCRKGEHPEVARFWVHRLLAARVSVSHEPCAGPVPRL